MAELQRLPARVDLIGDDSLRWDREFSRVIVLYSSDPPNPGTNEVDLENLFSQYRCEIRTANAARELVCTGTASLDPDGDGVGTDGQILVTFPATGWVDSDPVLGAHQWDLVGEEPSGTPFQLLEGRAEVRTSTTVL